VDRKKPPALTSPWKVGFLVALMLVVTGLGVSYFITGAFGLKWNWIELGGLSPTQWTFHLDAFINEMAPLVALVALLATASCALVAGAVRRYKKFVDSGSEYKQLLRSIKSFEDLEDEELMESLKQHPELREFLMSLKNRIAARERQTSEREKRPAPARESGQQPGNLPAESSVLVHAIMEDTISGEIGLTIPELKQIERAVRERLARAAEQMKAVEPVRAPEPVKEIDPAGAAAISTLSGIRNQILGVRRDADACANGAREMEELLGSLKQAVDSSRDGSVGTDGLGKITRNMDIIADTLVTLGEDTRRIAIAAALHASGSDTEGDAIKVAEDVRTIATRFNGVAQTWKETGPALRATIDGITKGATSGGKRHATLTSAASTAAAKASLWGERLVALMEQIRAIEEACGAKSPARPAPAPAAASSSEWGTIDEKLDSDLDDEERMQDEIPPIVEVPQEADAEADPDFVKGTVRNVFETPDAGEDAPFTDIPGFEKDRRIFAEQQAAAGTAGEVAEDSPIEVEAEAHDWRVKSAADEIESIPAGADTEEHPEANEPEEGFLTGPRGKVKPKAVPEKPASAVAAKPKPKKAAQAPAPEPVDEVEEDVDSDAIDLYLVGAVDYVEGVHA
jgi:hypothetical protein